MFVPKYVHMRTNAHGGEQRASDGCLGDEVTGGCKLPDMSADSKLGSSAEAVLLSLQFPLQPFLYERMKNRKQNPSSSPPRRIISQVSQLPLACSEVQW